MKIAIGSDHRGIALKNELVKYLGQLGFEAKDMGPFKEDSVDYPDYAFKVAEAVSKGCADSGVVICHSGIGVSVTANKVKGIRAALCQTPEQGELARKHTNANVIALAAGFINTEMAKAIVKRWLEAEFEGGRHEGRLDKIRKIEDEQCK
jgi:ribose 5-phosphate isomerase B